MTSQRLAEGSARAVWVLLVALASTAGVLILEPGLRSPAIALAAIAAVGLVLLGVVIHRPQSPAWLLLALMVAFWGAGVLVVYAHGSITPVATDFVWAGQLVATAVTIYTVRSGSRTAVRSFAARLDLLIIATVFTVVGFQIVTAATNGTSNPTALAVASIDVALLGMLLRFAVSRRRLGVSSILALLGALVTVAYDLSSAVHGRRLALPGEASEILGVISLLLFGVAALHPSMTAAFSAETFAQRRRASASLLGLLPLVLVPVGVWAVAEASGARSLPAWVVPTAGAVIAGLCLIRGSAALRSSEHLAEHDPLTDLANRRGLALAFDELAPAGGRSLLLVDIDEFKQVNDTHGHDIGDALLLRLRDRLVSATGTAGLVARLGGDEFVVLTRPEEAPVVAERFLRTLRDPFVLSDLVLGVGASIGIAGDQGAATLAELLTHADVAMYAAKAAGGSRALHFHPSMRVEVARRFTLSSAVRQLLASQNPDVGVLEIHFQPLVELRSGEIVGAEALVRWQHPQLGLLAPDSFLPLVSNNNLDADLDTAVLRAVIAHLAAWREQGRRVLPVSVNLTRDSLEDPGLGVRILGVLADAGVPTSQLHVEITEHDHLSAAGPAEATLDMLKSAGVGIYLDDFGTGYTSLEYLRRFPIEVLKLDRSVVTSLEEGQVQLVAGVNAMALALDLQVLAEGVETAAQRDLLVELGVRYGQGFLFSRPLPAEQYAETVLGRGPALSSAPEGGRSDQATADS